MICPNCGSNDWHDTKLHPKSKLLICKPCGGCWHEVDPANEKKMREYYRVNYRKDKVPGQANILTTTNKKNYVQIFLKDFLAGKKGLTIGDVGAATGYLLHHFKEMGHNVTGSEWTTTYRRFSEHYYGIPLTEELETKHRYDLIIMYHTFEHMMEPDKKLAHYKSLLKEGGHMLISTPRWFYIADESALGKWHSFENFLHPDHINVFSRESLLNQFRKAGLRVIKEDEMSYGQTYLLEQCNVEPIIPESWEGQLDSLKRLKAADELFRNGKKKDAVDLFYNFPDAHLALLTDDWGKDREKQADYYEGLLAKHPQSRKLQMAWGGWLYQGQRYEESLKVMLDVMEHSPNADLCVFVAWCYSMLGDHKQAMSYFNWAQNLNPLKWGECIDGICREACQIPAWDERAVEQLKNELFQKHLQEAT